MKLEKLLNRNLIIFIFVAIVIGIVIFLTFIYEDNRKAAFENKQKFNVVQQEIEEKEKEEAEILKGLSPENIESKIKLNTTQLGSIKRILRTPVNTEVFTNGLVRNQFIVNTGTNNQNTLILTFFTDSSGKVTLYTYGPHFDTNFQEYTKKRALSGEADFVLGTTSESNISTHVYLSEGVSITVAEGQVDYVSRFVPMEKETYLKYFSNGRPILE
jgi:hypothetical protein